MSREPEQTVTDGQTIIGEIYATADQFTARDGDGNKLGTFPSIEAARSAIIINRKLNAGRLPAMAETVTKLIARIGDDAGREISLKGRPAWAAAELLKAGAAGCTPITHPGPRWSAYVHKLRGAGLTVETIHESHQGEFPGHHARYVLHTPLVVIEEVRA